MKVEYSILVLAVGLVYALVKQFLHDFPFDGATFQVGILYLLIKLGVEVVKPVASKVRAYFSVPASKKLKSR